MHPSPDTTLPMIRDGFGAEPQRARDYDVAGATDVGNTRKQNEDQYLIADLQRTMKVRGTSVQEREDSSLIVGAQGLVLAVADGMGGMGHGDVASSVTIDALVQHIVYCMPWRMQQQERDEDLLSALYAALQYCQARLQSVARRKGVAHQHMGTTLTMAYITWPMMYVLHAGDSRCYIRRAGQLSCVTKDHTVAEQMRSAGALGPHERTRMDHMLINSVGGSADEPYAELHAVTLQEDDQILLCSDGLTGEVTDKEIESHLQRMASAEECCEQLIATAKHNGGRDNITAVVASL